MNTFAACRNYVAKLPPGISGAGGHPATFRAACECVRFGLGDGEAMAVLREFNQRCQPPWTEKELAHKLSDARREAGGQTRGCYQQQAPAVRVVWKLKRKVPLASKPADVAIGLQEFRTEQNSFTSAKRASEPSDDLISPDPISTPSAGIPPDCFTSPPEPWMHVARQIVAGEFNGCDRSTRESLTIGLRSYSHPVVRRALEILGKNNESR